MKINKHNMVHLALLGMILSIPACNNSGSRGSSGGNNTDNGDASSLQIITPKTIFSKPGVAGSSYVVINNPTATIVKNIQYSLTNLTGGASGASVDPASAANCATVAAYSQCNVKVTVESGAVAGSLGLSVSNDSSLLAKLSKSAKAASATPIMGVEQAAYNSLSGADGITLSYYNTVINGTPYVLVSGLVASNNAGTFNKIVLIDTNGNEIPNQVLIRDDGVSSIQGSTFNILLPVPAGTNVTQTIKVQTQQVTNSQTTVVSTSTASSTLTTKENIGIAEMLPSAVYLTETNPEQIVTFLNTGDAIVQLQQLVSNNPNVEVVFSSTSLSSRETTTAILKLKDKTVTATTGNVTLIYNNGQSQTTISSVVDQNVNPIPTPTPTPVPTPSPTPVPPPPPAVPGLTAVLNPDNDFFKTSAGEAVTRQLTLTNTGNTPEDNIILALPPNFTISAGSSNSCTVTQSANPGIISDSLVAQTGSCDVTVTYANTTVTPETSEDINIGYNYNNGTPATPTTAAVNYRVTQSTAVLSLTDPWSPYNFINIPGVPGTVSAPRMFTLYNSGEIDATNVVGSINPTSIFSILSNYDSTIATGASGNLNLQFGPSSAFGHYNTTLTVNYDDYPTHAATPVTVDITGSVSNAVAYLHGIAAPDFAGGNGQSTATAYTLQTGNSGQITLTYKNKGNEDAQNFRLTTGTISSKLTGIPFTLLTDGCNLDNGGKTLVPNETCDEVLQYIPTATGATTLPLNTANWKYSYSDTHGNYTYNSDPVYFYAYDISIEITGVSSWQTIMGSAYAFTATITGGSSKVTPTVTGLTGNNTVSPTSCNLNSAVSGSESCMFMVIPYTGSSNYSFWDPTSISNSIDVNTPANAYTYNGVSLKVSATNNAVINKQSSPQTFGITGTVIAPYVYLPAPMVGAAIESNTGITWGTGGAVATRFGAGTQNGGGTCADSQKDNLTELEWLKNANEVCSGGCTWSSSSVSGSAQKAVADFNTGGGKCGYTDWRLPTLNELRSLINYAATQSGSNPATWLNSQGFSNIQADDYWSSRVYNSDASQASLIYFANGVNVNASSSDLNHVWPVRGGQQ